MKRILQLSAVVATLAWSGLTQPIQARQSEPAGKPRFLDITVGMGIDLHSATSIVDYINLVAQPRSDQKLSEFSSAVEFFVVPELQFSDSWSAGLEYSLLIKSYSIDDRSGFSRSEFSYQVHMPTMLLHRVVFGEGYRVKMGGGIGYHLAEFTQRFPSIGSEVELVARGIAFKVDIVGNTQFDETMYGSIGLDLRWDFAGALERSGSQPGDANTSVTYPKMNFFSVGLKFGVTFQLN